METSLGFGGATTLSLGLAVFPSDLLTNLSALFLGRGGPFFGTEEAGFFVGAVGFSDLIEGVSDGFGSF